MSLLLQHKISVVWSPSFCHERAQLLGIETEMKHIHYVQYNVNTPVAQCPELHSITFHNLTA